MEKIIVIIIALIFMIILSVVIYKYTRDIKNKCRNHKDSQIAGNCYKWMEDV